MAKAHTTVTPELIKKAKKYLTDPMYKGLSKAEVARLLNIAPSTLYRIEHGGYDNPKPVVKPTEQNNSIVSAHIEFAELQHLFACEQIVKEMLDCSKLSDTQEDALYFPRNCADTIFKRHVPELVQERLDYLSTLA